MDMQEITELLLNAAESRSGKFVPWWEDNFENCDYRNLIFTPEEIQQVEEAVASCGVEVLSAPVGTEGYSLFHLLVWLNFYTAAERALNAGVDADIMDSGENGVTPLLFACSRGNFAMAKLLCGHGADKAHCDAKGRNGFHYLAHPFAKGLEITEPPRHSLSQRKEITMLLAQNADINQKDAQGIAPLVYLVDGGLPMICVTLIDTYLKLGADPYFVDDNGGTLLYRAILRGRATAALRLMEYPELVAQKTASGKTVLMEAAEREQEGICIALKDHGAEGDYKEFDSINLARLANNAFTNVFGGRQETDPLAIGIYFTKKLIALAKEEEDYGCLEYILDDALRDESARVLDLFHEAGIDFNEPYYGGCDDVNCLRDKCMECCRNADIVKKLEGFGVDMERAVISGRNPAIILASWGDCEAEVFRLFSAHALEERDNTGRAAIHYATMREGTDMLSVMLSQGVDVNLTQDAPAEAGNTPLHLACLYGNIEAAKLLMDSGADDTMKNAKGETPAHKLLLPNTQHRELTTEERKELFSLLKHVDVVGNSGETPLLLLMSWSISKLHLEIKDLLAVLLEKGVDVNRRNYEGKTALLLCADNFNHYIRQINLIKMLHEAGADLNATDAEGNNALYYVFRFGAQNVAKYLLKNGADYLHTNNEGVTPAQVAVEKGYDTLFGLMPGL